jgi:esterase/lipase superfamily enzyme
MIQFPGRIFLIICAVLAGCAPRGVISIAPNESAGEIQSVLVGSTRGLGEGDENADEERRDLRFGRFEISVPPSHELGEIEWPSRHPDASKHFLTRGFVGYDAGAFRAEVAREMALRAPDHRSVILFVHGYNVTFAEGLYRFAQVIHDTGIPGVPVHYSWPSAGNPLGYGYDRDSMLYARDGLEQVMAEIARAGGEIVLIGHSMGALLIMETLRQIAIRDRAFIDRHVGGVALISPDLDIEIFRQQAKRIGPLPQPFVIFSSSRDKVLRLSATLTGRRDRLGNIADVRELSDLQVTVLDVSAFADGGANHNTALASASFLRLVNSIPLIDSAFSDDPASRIGLLPGTVLVVHSVTEIIINPF